jgi:hypothetical protein
MDNEPKQVERRECYKTSFEAGVDVVLSTLVILAMTFFCHSADSRENTSYMKNERMQL